MYEVKLQVSPNYFMGVSAVITDCKHFPLAIYYRRWEMQRSLQHTIKYHYSSEQLTLSPCFAKLERKWSRVKEHGRSTDDPDHVILLIGFGQCVSLSKENFQDDISKYLKIK